MKKMGIEATFVDPLCTEEELNAAFRPNTKVVFGETIANPALTVLDIEKFARAAHAHGVPLIVALLTSTALWGVVSKVILKRMELTAKRSKADEAQRKMLVGLAHDRIIHLGMVYIERGCITQDEYENLQVYLYEPYEEMGGNGSARRVMEEVRKLPIR